MASTSVNSVGSFTALFQEMEQDAERCQASELSKKTMHAVRGLFERREEIARIASETDRNTFITNTLGFLAEPYFCDAPTEETRRVDLEGKANLVLHAYKSAKESADLQNFFNTLGRATRPCFAGRLNNITDYAASVSLQVTKEELEKTLFDCKLDPQISFKFYNMIGQLAADHKEKIPDQQTFVSFLSTTNLSYLCHDRFLPKYYELAKEAVIKDIEWL